MGDFVGQSIRYQGRMHKTAGTPGSAPPNAGGSYAVESYTFSNVAGASTDAILVAATTGKRVRVLSFCLSCVVTGASTVQFNSKPGGAGTAISPTYSLAGNQSLIEVDENGLFQTTAGQGLSVNTGTNIVGIRVTYILVD